MALSPVARRIAPLSCSALSPSVHPRLRKHLTGLYGDLSSKPHGRGRLQVLLRSVDIDMSGTHSDRLLNHLIVVLTQELNITTWLDRDTTWKAPVKYPFQRLGLTCGWKDPSTGHDELFSYSTPISKYSHIVTVQGVDKTVWMIGRWCRSQVSRLMLLPNLAYNSTFSCSISSRIVLNTPWTLETAASISSMDFESSPWTSGIGNLTKISPILYL